MVVVVVVVGGGPQELPESLLRETKVERREKKDFCVRFSEADLK